MELKDFVKEALRDILDAVSEAQDEIASGEIAPQTNTSIATINSGVSNLQTINFEVTVSADESTGSKAKLNVVAAIVGANVQGESNQVSTQASKLSFRVPIKFHPKRTKP